jgi:hypothetical protein
MTKNLLLIMDITGELLAPGAVINIVLYSAFKYEARMSEDRFEPLQLFWGFRIGSCHAAIEGANLSIGESTYFASYATDSWHLLFLSNALFMNYY